MTKAPDNIISKTLNPPPAIEHEFNIWIEGRWVYYAPTFFPTHEVKERGGRWDNKKQAWRVPRLTREIQFLREYDTDATYTRDIARFLEPWEEIDAQVAGAIDTDWQTGTLARDNALYHYQMLAVRALVTRPFHGKLLCLSPGLGKTPTSIVAGDIYMKERGQSQRALVVAPLSLIPNWVREIEKWSDDPRVEALHQESPTPDRSVRWSVANYDSILERVKDPHTDRWTVSGNLKEDFDFDWDLVIFDESVLLKNRKSKRTQVARSLAFKAQQVWLLSGAPITRDNSDLWSQMNILEPDYFSAFWRFAEQFCIVVQTPWAHEIMGSRKDIHVRNEFPDLMFVRNQEEVFEDLPEYIYQDYPIELHPKQKKAHDDVLSDWIHQLEENADKRVEVTAVIAMLTRLQQITSNLYNLETTGTSWPDYSSKADFVEELFESGEIEWPVLIWMHHRPGTQALFDRLFKRVAGKAKEKKGSVLYGRRVEKVVGGTKGADQIIEDFKAGKVDVLQLGITVGKYGHTLANAHTIITYDKTWDADAWFQMLHRAAGARAKIAGFTHRPLLINPRCRGTVDDYVELNLAGKLPSMADMTGADLAKILRSLGEDHLIT